jgi:hypothetical protein
MLFSVWGNSYRIWGGVAGTHTLTPMEAALPSTPGALAMWNDVSFEDCAERCAQSIDTAPAGGPRLEAPAQEGGLLRL